jgi:hypothetical protein
MAATKSPISLDPLTASNGVPGRITWAFVQTGCTIRLRLKGHFTTVCVRRPAPGQYAVLANSSGRRICRAGDAVFVSTQGAQRESEARSSVMAPKPTHALKCATRLHNRNLLDDICASPEGFAARRMALQSCGSLQNLEGHHVRLPPLPECTRSKWPRRTRAISTRSYQY